LDTWNNCNRIITLECNQKARKVTKFISSRDCPLKSAHHGEAPKRHLAITCTGRPEPSLASSVVLGMSLRQILSSVQLPRLPGPLSLSEALPSAPRPLSRLRASDGLIMAAQALTHGRQGLLSKRWGRVRGLTSWSPPVELSHPLVKQWRDA